MKKNFEIRSYYYGEYYTAIIPAESRAQAKYLFWLRATDARPDLSFLDVLKTIQSVKEVKQ